MRLTKFSDYALRVLILAASKNEQHTTIEEAAHLLNRAGFGGSPGEIRRLHKLGRREAVEIAEEGTTRVQEKTRA